MIAVEPTLPHIKSIIGEFKVIIISEGLGR